jgi:hypothetical protein
VKQLHGVNWMRWAIVLTGSIVNIIVISIAQPVRAEAELGSGESGIGNRISEVGGNSTSEVVERLSAENDASPSPLDSTFSSPLLPTPHSLLPHLNDLDQPATTVDEWMQQIAQSLVQVIGVQVNSTEDGVEVILETADGSLAVPETRTMGTALIADIPNATIAEEFSQANPIEGIALVNVTSLPGNRVRVAITGTDAPPVAEVTAEAQGLAFAVTLGEAGTAAEEESIQVVVTGEQDEGYNSSSASTATRTDTPLRDIPQAITVVPRQVIEDRNAMCEPLRKRWKLSLAWLMGEII